MLRPPLVTPEGAAALRDAVLAVPGVAGVDAGRFGEVALLLPGQRVDGFRPSERDGRRGLEAHLVFDVSSGRNVRDVARDARAAIVAATDPESVGFVDIIVTDAR